MIDSFEAPTDLSDARARMMAAAVDRCHRLRPVVDRSGEESVPVDGAVVRLTGKRFIEGEIGDGTAAVVAEVVLWRWNDASLRTLAERLPPGAALVFCEPTADLGWRRGVHRMTKNIWWLTLRHNFESDVPARLRAAGLMVTTTDRFSIGPWGIRSYVWGVAEHIG